MTIRCVEESPLPVFCGQAPKDAHSRITQRPREELCSSELMETGKSHAQQQENEAEFHDHLIMKKYLKKPDMYVEEIGSFGSPFGVL